MASAGKKVPGIKLGKEFEKLTQLIRKNEYPGDFFCSGVLPVIPDIHFKDTTFRLHPSFPQSHGASTCQPITVTNLISLCDPAPFGRGQETVVDPSVRSCWQLDSDKVIIKSSGLWKDAFADLKQSICIALAPGLKAADVELRLYKMLVYEKGSHFLPHRDTQRDANHFGTLVISLPVEHTGGALHVRHMGEERIHKMEARHPSKQCPWAAFFTDVEHEIKEITSGHRITLVYHLYRTGNTKIDPPVPSGEHPIIKSLKHIQECLTKIDNEELEYLEYDPPYYRYGKEYYFDDYEDPGPDQYSHAGYLLEHKYTPSSLNPMNLKGRDGFLYHLLSEAGFELRLVAVELRINSIGADDSGRCDQLTDIYQDTSNVEFSELDLSTATVTGACPAERWNREGGKKREMFPSRPMEEVTWLVKDITKHAKALKRVDKYIQGTGNEGCDWHSTYVTTALVINLMPGQEVTRNFSFEHTRRPYPNYGS